MAEETLRYRVEIDQSDLAGQLASLKNQIDTAVGSVAFNNAEPLQNSSLIGGVSNFVGAADAGFDQFSQSASNLRTFLSQGLETSQLGFQKFTSDLRMAGLTSPPQYATMAASPGIGASSYVPPQVNDYGLIKSSLGATFGLGYDPNMYVSRGEYREMMADKSGSMFADKLINTTSLGLGLGALPFLSTPLGAATAVAGAALGLGNAVVDAGAFEYNAVNNFGKFIETTSFRNVGSLSNSEGRQAAAYIRNLSENVNIRAAIGDATDVENLVTEGISSGLFINTGNVEEFKTRAKELVENFRTIQHTMRVSSEEAMQIIGDISRSGMASNVSQVTSLVGQARSLGDTSGYTSKEMLGIAAQSAEMVRGTGYSMNAAAMQGMQTVALVRGAQGNFDQEFFRQMGGSQNVALNLQRMGHEFDASVGGRFYNLAQVGGWSPSQGADLATLMGSAVNAFGTGSPEDILSAQINLRGQSKQTTGFQKNMMEILSAQENLRLNLGIDNASRDQLEQSLINMGRTEAEAKMLAGMATTSVGSYYKSVLEPINDMRQQAFYETPGVWDKFKAATGAGIRSAYRSTLGDMFGGIAEAKTDLGNWWEGVVAPLTGNRLPGELSGYFNAVSDVEAYLNKQESGGFSAKEIQRAQGYARRGGKTDMELLRDLGSAGQNDLEMMQTLSSNIQRLWGSKRGITQEETSNMTFSDVSSLINQAKSGEALTFNGKDVSHNTLRKLLLSSDFSGWDESLQDSRIYASMTKKDVEAAQEQLTGAFSTPLIRSRKYDNTMYPRIKKDMRELMSLGGYTSAEEEIISNIAAISTHPEKLAELYLKDPAAFSSLEKKLGTGISEYDASESLTQGEASYRRSMSTTRQVLNTLIKQAQYYNPETEGEITNAGMLVAMQNEIARAGSYAQDNAAFFKKNDLTLDTDAKKLFAHRYLQGKQLNDETAESLKMEFRAIESLERVHKLSPDLIERGMSLDKDLKGSLEGKEDTDILKLLLQSSLRLEKYYSDGKMEDKANAASTPNLPR